MSLFGPFYPPGLQASINHAERLARVLLQEESSRDRVGSVPEWLIGRAGELERFVEAVVDDWRAGHRPPESVAMAVDAYLGALHEGLAGRVGVRAPECCRGDVAPTAVPARPSSPRPSAVEVPPDEGTPPSGDCIDQLLRNLDAPAPAARTVDQETDSVGGSAKARRRASLDRA
jgi:hypothetical protein